MTTELMRMEITLESLDSEHAVFAGLAEETIVRRHPLFGETEIDAKYPMVYFQRAVWEILGQPTSFMLVLEGKKEAEVHAA
jgi:hypothetical protein